MARDRYRTLFHQCPSPLVEEDYSAVLKFLATLAEVRAGNVSRYLREHPDVLAQCADMVRITDINAAAADLLGGKPGDGTGGGVCRLVCHEPEACLEAALVGLWLGQAAPGAGGVLHECDILGERARILWRLLPGDDETWERVLVCISPVAGPHDARLEFRRAEARLRLLAEAVGEPVFTVREDGTCLAMNNTAARDMGGRPDDFVGKTMWDLFPKDIADSQMATILRAVTSGQAHTAETTSIVGGRQRWYDTTIQPLRDAGGAVTSAQVIARDVTDRVRAEQEIGRLDAFRRAVLDNPTLWVQVLDGDGRVQEWNGAAEAISGYSRDDVLGERIWRVLCPDEAYRERVARDTMALLERGDPIRDIEVVIRCKDGQVKAIVWSGRAVLDEQGRVTGIIAFGQDAAGLRSAD